MATYTNTSPWYLTPLKQDYLDILNIRPVSAEVDDFLYKIQPQYAYRPDLLAYDIYGDSQLWWVFAVRNKDVIKDSVYDFVPGQTIFLPQMADIKKALGY